MGNRGLRPPFSTLHFTCLFSPTLTWSRRVDPALWAKEGHLPPTHPASAQSSCHRQAAQRQPQHCLPPQCAYSCSSYNSSSAGTKLPIQGKRLSVPTMPWAVTVEPPQLEFPSPVLGCGRGHRQKALAQDMLEAEFITLRRLRTLGKTPHG